MDIEDTLEKCLGYVLQMYLYYGGWTGNKPVLPWLIVYPGSVKPPLRECPVGALSTVRGDLLLPLMGHALWIQWKQQNIWYSEYTSNCAHTDSTGNAVRKAMTEPKVGITNLVLTPGRTSTDELIQSVKKGGTYRWFYWKSASYILNLSDLTNALHLCLFVIIMVPTCFSGTIPMKETIPSTMPKWSSTLTPL